MPKPHYVPEVPAEAARALRGAIPVPSCPACGKALTPRQRACSGRCRAALSRRRQDRAREARDQELRQLLEVALRILESHGRPRTKGYTTMKTMILAVATLFVI